MIAILIVLAGYCLIFGARGLAEKMLRVAAGLVLILTFLSGLLSRCDVRLGSAPRPSWSVPSWAIAIPILVVLGYVAWKTRAWRSRRREALAKRDGAPRDRSLPPPPRAEEGQP